MSATLQFQIQETTGKNRLDRFLFGRITRLSKMFISNRIDAGCCKVNGSVETRGGRHLLKGDKIEIEADLTAHTSMMPEALPIEIVFEDDEIIVVNKPPEMLAHPSAQQKSGTLLNALSYHLNHKLLNSTPENFAGSDLRTAPALIRPGLIHRLDRKTSGLTVVAKTPKSLSFLSKHFQKRLVKKIYLAIVSGVVQENSGKINEPIGYYSEEKIWNVKADGKVAETNFQVLERFSGAALLELEPVTGRTNQLRIHCAFVGHPIVGDERYGGDKFSRLCLHAARLGFYHPVSNDWMEFKSEPSFNSDSPRNF